MAYIIFFSFEVQSSKRKMIASRNFWRTGPPTGRQAFRDVRFWSLSHWPERSEHLQRPLRDGEKMGESTALPLHRGWKSASFFEAYPMGVYSLTTTWKVENLPFPFFYILQYSLWWQIRVGFGSLSYLLFRWYLYVFISFSSQVALEIKVVNSPAASQSSQSSL